MAIAAVDTYNDTWSKGWTSFAPFQLDGQQYFLCYKSESGRYSIDRVAADGTSETSTFGQGSWPAGYTTVMPFVWSDAPHMLVYNAGTGDVAFHKIAGASQATEQIWSGSWSKEWTSFTPLPLSGGAYYLAYKSGSGRVTIDRINDDGQDASSVYNNGGNNWDTGYNAFAAFTSNGGQPHVLLYNSETGVAEIDRVAADGSDMTSVTRQQWSTGWSAFVPFEKDGDSYYFGYKSTSGEVAIEKFRGDASGSDRASDSSFGPWNGDWTSFAPLLLGGSPGYIVYKTGSGKVAIGFYREPASAASTVGPARAPARSASAEGGRVFLDRMTSEGVDVIGHGGNIPARDQKFHEQLVAGNMPDFCRQWAEVSYDWNGKTVKVWITPDCIAIGSNEDWLRVNNSGSAAQRLANLWGCQLPTAKILLKAFLQAGSVKLHEHAMAAYINGSKYQSSNAAMRWHEDIIQGVIGCDSGMKVPADVAAMFDPQLGAHGSPPSCTMQVRTALDQIAIGHKKEICLPYFQGYLTFWGFWYQGDAAHPRFRQEGNHFHTEPFTDYSQGMRLLHPNVEIDGTQHAFLDVLESTELRGAILDESGLSIIRDMQKAGKEWRFYPEPR
jgi:hypothetical protein